MKTQDEQIIDRLNTDKKSPQFNKHKFELVWENYSPDPTNGITNTSEKTRYTHTPIQWSKEEMLTCSYEDMLKMKEFLEALYDDHMFIEEFISETNDS